MSVADAFCRDLVDAMPTPHARMVCISVLARYAGTTVYLPCGSKAQRREQAARHALANGMGAAEVATVLRKRFGVSVRTALRDVKAAKTNA